MPRSLYADTLNSCLSDYEVHIFKHCIILPDDQIITSDPLYPEWQFKSLTKALGTQFMLRGESV